MQHVITTSMCYLTHYSTFSVSVAWFRLFSIYKKIYINIFVKKNDGNAWYRVANSPKPGKSQRKYIVTPVVTRSSYGDALH